jgi:hemerythrin-like domain-containing protein
MDTQPNVGNDLVRIHKVITRALQVSLESSQDANLEQAYREGFRSYLRAMTILLHAHHGAEDELAFPFWQIRMPNGPYDQLFSQHRQMIAYLERIEHWLEAGPQAWQADEINQLHETLSGLWTLWEGHINLEEEAVGPENSSKYLTPAENEQLSKQLSEHGQAHSQPGELVMPFIVFNLPEQERAEFVKLLPPVVVQQLIPHAWKNVWEPMTPFLLVT